MIPQFYKQFQHWGEHGTVWIYSDPHFGDEELRTGKHNRPCDGELLRMINSKVGRKDTLICLGDVGDIEFARKLHGYKVLICGNHDIGATNYERQIVHQKFDKEVYSRQEAIAKMKELYPDCKVRIFDEGYSFHAPFEYWVVEADNCLFDEVYTGPLIVGEKIILSHEPIPGIFWALNIHGHDHKGLASDIFHKNVCADVIKYEPVHLNSFLKSGALAKIPSIHRVTIDKATERKKKRK